MIEIKNLHKSYDKLEVLKGINFTINDGDVVAILGPSGSGKTTVLRCMNFLVKADKGTIIFDGKEHDLANISHKEVSEIRKKTGFVFQNYNLVPILNVYENIVLPIELDGTKVDTEYVKTILHTLGLEQKVQAMPNQLSGGQQQRVAIARALAAKPAILLADEPTGNLDSKTGMDVIALLKMTSQAFHQTIVMITHNEEIAQMADRIIRIEDGKIVSEKQTMQMMDKNPNQKEGADCVEREK